MQIINKCALEVLKDISTQGKKVDLIVTDPPYRVTSKGCTGTSGGMFLKKINMKGQVFKHNDIAIQRWAPLFFEVLKEGGHCYIMTNHKNLQEYLNVLTSIGFHFIKNIIWDKGNKIMGRFYMSQYEYIIFLRKGKGVKINKCGTSDILSIPNIKSKNSEGKNVHDTEKPVELMKVLIENSSQEGETVLDPFMGIGTTLIACQQLGRKGIGVEIDEHYYSIANHRINKD